MEEAGADVATMFDHMTRSAGARAAVPDRHRRRQLGIHVSALWGIPTRNTLDRATVMLPELMYRRLDELGIDFAVLYPTYGLPVTAIPNAELRCALARALNRYYAEVYADYRDRLEPVAAIPTFTPDEAIAELDHAVGELGLKAVMLGGTIPRPYDSDPGGPGRWVDTLGHDSMYDYDPVWRRCEELGVAPTFHSGGQGWGTRMSTRNNSYNQVGNFAAADEGTCRSLVFGGVAKRFPNVHFAFQEGGVAWASALLAGLVGHWEKRNIEAIQHYNPANLDQALLQSLFAEHATGGIADRVDRLADSLVMLSDPDELPQDIDQFAESLLTGVEDLYEIFSTRFYFGCEADDPMNAMAFAADLNPGNTVLPAVFASDVGHWDVPDMRKVVPEAYELVEHGHIDEAQFRDFVFANPARLWTSMNPDFFAGTAIADSIVPA
ncbi:MAG: amidohydrolase family protein [Acidimicrobiales bacterium]|nr:amidohydrolase family protein [Acidimicrobiales bacterium]